MTEGRHPERQRLETLADLALKRLNRAVAKAQAAKTELAEADAAVDAVTSRLTAWFEANPDQQSSLLDLIASKGEDHE